MCCLRLKPPWQAALQALHRCTFAQLEAPLIFNIFCHVAMRRRLRRVDKCGSLLALASEGSGCGACKALEELRMVAGVPGGGCGDAVQGVPGFVHAAAAQAALEGHL